MKPAFFHIYGIMAESRQIYAFNPGSVPVCYTRSGCNRNNSPSLACGQFFGGFASSDCAGRKF